MHHSQVFPQTGAINTVESVPPRLSETVLAVWGKTRKAQLLSGFASFFRHPLALYFLDEFFALSTS